MKKILSLACALCLVLVLVGCGSSSSGSGTEAQTPNTESAAQTQESQTEAQSTDSKEDSQTAEGETDPQSDDSTDALENTNETEVSGSTLVVYFSCTGTTKGVAETIAQVTGGDLFEIIASETYTSDDLNYNDNNSRTTKEQNDKSVRPEISGSIEGWDAYSTVYLGYPIWWGEEPRILDTFVESYDFTGKTVIPFCTSGGSGVGRSDDNLAANAAGDGKWLEGTRLKGGASEGDISDWIAGLNIN